MKNVSVDDLKKKIDPGAKTTIIDVRTFQEIERGKIEGSINIPLDLFESQVEEKIPDKNTEVYLYCLSGSRSVMAAQIMDEKGYKNVNNVISGMLAWRNKGYPLS